MSLTDLMPSTKDMLIKGLQARLTEVTTLLARGVHERDLDEATPGTPLWDSRVLLGLDGKTGARDVRSDVVGLSPVPVVLAVDPGVQTAQARDVVATEEFRNVVLELPPRPALGTVLVSVESGRRYVPCGNCWRNEGGDTVYQLGELLDAEGPLALAEVLEDERG